MVNCNKKKEDLSQQWWDILVNICTVHWEVYYIQLQFGCMLFVDMLCQASARHLSAADCSLWSADSESVQWGSKHLWKRLTYRNLATTDNLLSYLRKCFGDTSGTFCSDICYNSQPTVKMSTSPTLQMHSQRKMLI